MKMFSKEGQTMVDIKRAKYDGTDIVVTAKLMDAYSMNIYLTPKELRSALQLADYSLISAIPDMLIEGTRNEDALRDIKSRFNEEDDLLDVIFGEKSAEKLRIAGKALGIDSSKSIIEIILPLLQMLLIEKE